VITPINRIFIFILLSPPLLWVGLNDQIVLRYDAAHKGLAYSSSFLLSDGSGKILNATQPVSMNVASGGADQTVVVNVGAAIAHP
jgi:hypothetical protein